MSSRVYDYILTVSDTSPFKQGNTVLGLTSKAFGYIANVDSSTSNIKVKMSNVDQEFSNSITTQISQGILSAKPGWIRLSIHPVTSNEEMEFILNAIEALCRNHQDYLQHSYLVLNL